MWRSFNFSQRRQMSTEPSNAPEIGTFRQGSAPMRRDRGSGQDGADFETHRRPRPAESIIRSNLGPSPRRQRIVAVRPSDIHP